MMHPEYRPRRLRRNETVRSMIRETSLSLDHLVYPLFVVPGKGVKEPVGAMPGCYQMSVDMLVEEARELNGMGVSAILLFGIPEEKDERGDMIQINTTVITPVIVRE